MAIDQKEMRKDISISLTFELKKGLIFDEIPIFKLSENSSLEISKDLDNNRKVLSIL